MGYELQITDLAGDEGRYSLNRVGMASMRGALYELGMLVCAPAPDFPATPSGGWGADVQNPGAAWVAYEDQVGAVVAEQYAAEPAGIPDYKLASNDNWLVTPDEIQAALDVLAFTERDRPGTVATLPDHVVNFIAYLHRALLHGGFRVK